MKQRSIDPQLIGEKMELNILAAGITMGLSAIGAGVGVGILGSKFIEE
jgi:ATP synthase subunit C.